MPIIKSAKKALRQSLRKKARNAVYKQKIRSLVKEARALVAQSKPTEAAKLIASIYKAADKAAKENIIEKGTANRIKSRLTLLTAKKAPTVTK
jgi:small subunit ribosomal protein S20